MHVDAAYGGYFGLIADALDEPARRAYAAIGRADSIVIDPHKHGLQPYGCGCVLFKDHCGGQFYKHDSPYTYFTSKQLHLGEISLECSRAGAAAVALWATQRLLPLTRDGAFAEGMRRGRRAALELDRRVREDVRFVALGGVASRSPNARDRGHPHPIEHPRAETWATHRSWTLWCGRCMQQTLGRLGAGAKSIRCVRPAGIASGFSTIAGIVVWAQLPGPQKRGTGGTHSHLPALCADETGARGVDGRDLGTAERGVRRSGERVKSLRMHLGFEWKKKTLSKSNSLFLIRGSQFAFQEEVKHHA